MAPADSGDNKAVKAQAERHLWGHFTTMGTDEDSSRIIERGEGPYVWDADGNRYLDGLAGLFVSQVGHGRTEIVDAMTRQAEKLAYFPLWTYTHPTAIELASRLAALAPGDINRAFFTSGGSESVESAWKLARQYFKLRGEPLRHKVVSRYLAYHGTSFGALSITGLADIREPFEPLVPGTAKAANTNSYRCHLCSQADACTLGCAADIEQVILREGPETVAAVYIEPVQNSGGCFTPASGYFDEVRAICDRYGVLMVSDEVICSFGRLGAWFGSERFGYQPDIITTAKGLTSGYAPLGAMLVSDRIAEPFLGTGESFLHGFTFAGHPVSCAAALASLDVIEREDLNGHVQANEGAFRAALESLTDLPIVGQVRGAGYFMGIELVKDRDTRKTFSEDESERLLRQFLSNRLLDLGLICRTDDRGEPVIQLAPPLICGPDQFDEIAQILRQAFTEAMAEMSL